MSIIVLFPVFYEYIVHKHLVANTTDSNLMIVHLYIRGKLFIRNNAINNYSRIIVEQNKYCYSKINVFIRLLYEWLYDCEKCSGNGWNHPETTDKKLSISFHELYSKSHCIVGKKKSFFLFIVVSNLWNVYLSNEHFFKCLSVSL